MKALSLPAVGICFFAFAPVSQATGLMDGFTAYQEGRHDEAVEILDTHLSAHPDHPWATYILGLSLARIGDSTRAETAYTRVLELDPDHAGANRNLARLYLGLDDPSRALPSAERAVELSPDGPSWRVLARVHHDLAHWAQAEEAYGHSLALDDEAPWTLNNYGYLLLEQGRYEEAMAPLARAVVFDGEVAEFQNNLGVACERNGYPGAAVEAYRRAREAGSANAEHNLARLPEGLVDSPALDLGQLAAGFRAPADSAPETAAFEDPQIPVGDLAAVDMPASPAPAPTH